jgi:hypothetical protein
MVRDKRPSEFGGHPGLIQGEPHEPSNSEKLHLIYGVPPVPPVGEEPLPAPETKKIK